MTIVSCPNCGIEGETGGFCENCGARLDVQSPGPSGNSEKAGISTVIPNGMPFGASVTFADTMWSGVASPVRIAFKAVRDIYANVAVSILNGVEVLDRRVHGCRPFQDEIVFTFNIQPRMPGASIELTVKFECKRDGSDEPDIFEGAFSVRVLEEQSHHINIDASTVVNGAGASVLQYKNDIGGGFSVPDRRFSPTNTVSLPIDVSLASTPRRLTLTREGGRIHLWSLEPDETIVCGRNDDCDYVLRVFDSHAGVADENRSTVISRRHFRFDLKGGRTLRIADGADEGSSSACGTSIGEMEIPSRGIPLAEGSYCVDLGTKFTRHGVLTLTVKVTMNDDGSLAGFSIERSDGLGEQVVAIVSRTVPFGGGRFAWDGRRFLFNGNRIIPGVLVDVDGAAYEVRTYHQRKK